MKYQDFENRLSNQFYNEEAYVDVSSLIHNLGLEKKKRRILWIPIIIGGLISLIALVILFNGYKNNDVDKKSFVENYMIASNTNSDNSVSKLESENSSVIINSNENKNNETNNSTTISERKTKNKSSVNYFNNPESSNQKLLIETPKELNTTISETPIIENESILTNETVSIKTLDVLNPKLEYANSLPKINKDVECPTFSKKSNLYFELIPEVGIFKPFKKLESLSSEPNEIFNLRNENEKTLEGIQAGLYLRLRSSKSPFSVRSGLEYQQLTEKMKLNYEYITRDTSIGIISVTVSQTGDTITTIYGEIVEETLNTGSQVAHHQFQTFDIPLVLGYEKNIGSFDLGVEAGVSFNITLRNKGNLLSTPNSFTTLPDNGLYKASLGLNYLGSIYLAKDFNSIGRFYVALRGRFLPSTFSSQANSIKQSYTYTGLHLGYVFSF